MKFAYIDNNSMQHMEFLRSLQSAYGEKALETECFRNRMQLFKWLKKEQSCTIVFSETVIDGEKALGIVAEIRRISPGTEVCFLTEHPGFALEAYDTEAIDYILKPATGERLLKTMAKYLRLHPNGGEKKIKVHTFGRFDIFVNDKIVRFSNKKAKELLALMIDRAGGSVTMEQVVDTLWEDRAYDEGTKALYRIALKNLRDTLERHGCRDILIESRGERCVDIDKLDCDFYKFMKSPEEYSHLFSGEYMLDYPWGEYTLAHIVRIFEKNLKMMPL